MSLKRSLLMLAAVCLWPTTSANTTYDYKGLAYTSTVNFSVCATGPCANYALGGKITGQFTTASPLPNKRSPTAFSGRGRISLDYRG